MSSKTLCNLVRAAVIAVAVCMITACGYILPSWGTEIARSAPELAYCYHPWLIFLWLAVLPCFAILLLIWKVSGAIRKEQVFTIQTASFVKLGAMILLFDIGFFFIGNILFLLLDLSDPWILFLSLFIDIFGVSLAVFAAVLSRYLTKAAQLQEEADCTI